MILLPEPNAQWPPTESMLGRRVVARPATVRRPLIGTVVDVEEHTVIIRAGADLTVAVHVLDIDPLSLVEIGRDSVERGPDDVGEPHH